ncbi:DUF2971 domain-containing protein [Moritella sp. 24]|uniref:DUF2971 domain-containing protein n=1 Tax=Moritella sp. 24 TaxID=2746230 RepID=UPI001BAD53B1|nr:DUF2971 domain-containing protein [Moritella sp. 24]QUM75539.1 DUF2971 domain-containing protein [Moritella sp. 24]
MFYKYRNDSQYTEMIFTTGKVHLSTASALNDPFECSLQEIGKDWIDEQIVTMKSAAVSGFVMSAHRAIKKNSSFFGLSSNEIKDVLENLSREKNLKSSYDYFKNIMIKLNGNPPSDCDNFFSNIDSQLNDVGIFSLSTCPLTQLLWAHYTEDHKGVCIGFTPTEGKKLNDPAYCLQVSYSDSIPKMSPEGFKSQMSFSMTESGGMYASSYQLAFSDETFRSAISTKPTCWSYEKEWRYVEPIGGEFPWPGKLSEIVFGLKCPEERREYYIKLAERNVPNEVFLYEIVIKSGSNKIERIPYKLEKTTPLMPLETEHINQDGNKVIKLSIEQFSHEIMELIKKGEIDEALYQVDNNLEVSPDAPHLLNLKGMALGFSGRHEAALSMFQKLDKQFPNIADNLYQQSCALEALNRDSDAIELLRKANELDHNDPSIPFNLGVIIIKTGGDINEARLFLNSAKLMGHPRAGLVIKELPHLITNQA